MSKIVDRINALRWKHIEDAQNRLIRRFLADKEFARGMANHSLHARIDEWLELRGGEKVLEVGCGPGKYVAMLATLGCEVTGVDPCHFPTWDLIRKKRSVSLIDNVYAESLPFTDGSFDGVLCLGALLYFNDPLKALREIRRVIKPGGKVIIRTVNKNNLYTRRTGNKLDPASKSLYTMPELIGLVEAGGLAVVKTFSYGFWPPMWINVWWYLACVWLPDSLQASLSAMLQPDHRVNNTVFALASIR